MEDQQIEIKGAYKSPDIKVIQTLSPLAIAKSLSESRQYVCNCLLQDLQTIEKENEEALALAMVRTRGSHTEYEKAKLRADERMKKPITGTTKQRLRQDVYSFMNNVITSIAFDRYQEDLIASGADEANVKSLYDHIQAILNGTIEDPILKSSGNYNEPEDFRQSSLFHSKSSSAYDNELQLSETATSQQNDVEFSVQELLERLYVHGLVRTHHEEKTKEVAVDIDIYSVVDGVAKNRIDIANDALIIMSDILNRTTDSTGSSQDLQSSPSIDVHVAGVPIDSPSFTVNFFQDIYKQATEGFKKDKRRGDGGNDGSRSFDKNITNNQVDGDDSDDVNNEDNNYDEISQEK